MLPYGYIFKFGNEKIYDPNGKIEEPLSDLDIINHNTKVAIMEIESALKTGKATFYLFKSKKCNDPWIEKYYLNVGTWDGTYKFEIIDIHKSWHNFAGPDGRRDCWFKIKDQLWHGVNIGDNDIVHAKRIKSRR